MKQAWVRGPLAAAVTGLMLVGYQNCSQNRFDSTSTDRTNASVSGGGTVTDNPKPTIDIGMSPYDGNVLSGGAQLCVHEIKLVRAKSASDRSRRDDDAPVARTVPNGFGGLGLMLASSRSVALETGDVGVAIVPAGTPVASLPFPVGRYEEVQFALRPGCGSANTASFVNAAGKAIAVNDATTLKFRGNFNLSAANPQLIVNVQPLMVALAKAKDAKEAKEALDNGCSDY